MPVECYALFALCWIKSDIYILKSVETMRTCEIMLFARMHCAMVKSSVKAKIFILFNLYYICKYQRLDAHLFLIVFILDCVYCK